MGDVSDGLFADELTGLLVGSDEQADIRIAIANSEINFIKLIISPQAVALQTAIRYQ